MKKVIVSILAVYCSFSALAAQGIAPNDIPIPWYSQKISGCPYAHCSLASSLMVFDYYKGMTGKDQRSPHDAEQKLIEYQKNYFLKKKPPFKHRTSIAQGGYYTFEIDSLAKYYEHMQSADYFMKKDYRALKKYIDKGIPVLVNVRHAGSSRCLIPGYHRHWVVLRGMTDTHVWINDPGRSAVMRAKAENRCFPIRKEKGKAAYFDGCWTGRYIVIHPAEGMEKTGLLARQQGKMQALNDVTQMQETGEVHLTPLDAQSTNSFPH